MKISKFYGISVAIVFLILTFNIADAIVPLPKEQERIYISGNIPYNTIGGDFSGDLALVAQTTGESFIVPVIDGSVGIGGGIGYTHIGHNYLGYGLELSYQRSSHDYTDLGFIGKATFNVLNFDIKGIFSYTPVEPYLVIGLAVPWLNIENGADLQNTFPVDAKFTGIGFNFGAGLDLFLMPNLSFGGRVGYRYISYNQAKGHGDKLKIEEGLNGSGVNICGNISFQIPIK